MLQAISIISGPSQLVESTAIPFWVQILVLDLIPPGKQNIGQLVHLERLDQTNWVSINGFVIVQLINNCIF